MKLRRRTLAVAVIGLTVLGCKSSEKRPAGNLGPSLEPAGSAGPGPEPAGAVATAEDSSRKQLSPQSIARPAGATLELASLDKRRRDDIDTLAFEPAREQRFCTKPAAVAVATIDVGRSLWVHDRATIDALGPDTFSLRRTLAKIAADSVAAGARGATAEQLFRDLWDTQNEAANAATPQGAHCDLNGTTLNGFPNACRSTADGAQAKVADLKAEMASYQAVGLVNRIDLAAEGWKNCGEHRIIYGRVGEAFGGNARSYIIFEAVLPNPRPGCQSGCRQVAEHWYALSKIADPAKRARQLEKLFYTGLRGFRPVVHVDHYAAKGTASRYGASGSGQIRTNQFLEQPWMLKEFKLALDCTNRPCKLDAVPIPVKINPDGNLWTESAEGLASDFQQSVLAQVGPLSIDDVNLFSYQVPVPFDAARSQSQSPVPLNDHYLEAYGAGVGKPNGFKSQLAARVLTMAPTLTEQQIVNRATALSCGGCHQPKTFGLLEPNSIGPGKSWPDSANFVHVKADADANGVHALSPAVTDAFLPFRAKNLAAVLSERECLCRFKKARSDVFEREALVRPPVKVQDLRDAEERLKGRINRDLTRKGQPTLPDLAPELEAQPLVLDEVRAAGADQAKQAVARRQAVQKLVAEEPPRKTVTGHFRAH